LRFPFPLWKAARRRLAVCTNAVWRKSLVAAGTVQQLSTRYLRLAMEAEDKRGYALGRQKNREKREGRMMLLPFE
jgi:hypothetical protein